MSKIDFDIDGISNVQFKAAERCNELVTVMTAVKEAVLESFEMTAEELVERVVILQRHGLPMVDQYLLDNKPHSYTELKLEGNVATFIRADGCHPLFRFLEVNDDEQMRLKVVEVNDDEQG